VSVPAGRREFSSTGRRLVHRSRKYRCVDERIRFADGKEAHREVVRHTGAAVVLGELADGRLVLVEVFRHAAGGWMVEAVAGTLEPGEPAAACAARELTEETGYTCAAVRFLASWYPSPGILDETMHLFHATGLEAGGARPEEDEFVEPLLVTKAEAAAMVREGRITDGKTLLALFLAGVIAAAPAGGGGAA
jgi:ADP-ribose pyrophosphatase